MSDLDPSGIRIGLPGEQAGRAAAIRAAILARRDEPGSATTIPLPHPVTVQPVALALHAYGLVGRFLVARASLRGGPLEVVIHADEASRIIGIFPNTPEGHREADACGCGAVEALRLAVGDAPPPAPAAA